MIIFPHITYRRLNVKYGYKWADAVFRHTDPRGLVLQFMLRAAFFAYAVVLAEALVGLALILGYRLRLACAVGLVLNTVFVFARGFGPIGPHIDSIYLVLEVVTAEEARRQIVATQPILILTGFLKARESVLVVASYLVIICSINRSKALRLPS